MSKEPECVSAQTLESFYKANDDKNCVLWVTKTEKVGKALGDRYANCTWRQKLKIIHKDGREVNKYVIVKSIPTEEYSKNYVLNNGFFRKEIKIYQDILPAMENFMRSNGDYSDFLWPSCIGMYKDILVLEDLTELDYRLIDPSEGLDLQHSFIAIRSLAKFHALSVILKDKGVIDVDEFDDIHCMVNSDARRLSMESKLKTIIEVFKQHGNEVCKAFAIQIENLIELIIPKLVEKGKRNESGFNVLNHGDPWTSNFMFKYSPLTDDVIGIKFFDFQLAHYNSYAFDIQYLLHTSIQANVRKSHQSQLLIAYHETLMKTFYKFSHPTTNVPSLIEISWEVRDKMFFGIIISLYLLDHMYSAPDEPPDVQNFLRNGGEIPPKLLKSKEFVQKLLDIIEPYTILELKIALIS